MIQKMRVAQSVAYGSGRERDTGNGEGLEGGDIREEEVKLNMSAYAFQTMLEEGGRPHDSKLQRPKR